MGTPPFCSKRAMRSRSAEVEADALGPGEVLGEPSAEDGVAEEGDCAELGDDEVARCWRAAMRSLRLTGVPRLDLEYRAHEANLTERWVIKLT